jgi:hypothetical protein
VTSFPADGVRLSGVFGNVGMDEVDDVRTDRGLEGWLVNRWTFPILGFGL